MRVQLLTRLVRAYPHGAHREDRHADTRDGQVCWEQWGVESSEQTFRGGTQLSPPKTREDFLEESHCNGDLKGEPELDLNTMRPEDRSQ